MKFLVVLTISIFNLSVGFADNSINSTLEVLNRVYSGDKASFNDAHLDVIKGFTQCPIDQENMTAELERNLFQDEGFCEYKTLTTVKESITLLEKLLKPKAARIFRAFRNNQNIEHITSRAITLQKVDTDCVQAHVRIVLKDGTLVWLDFN